jgi:hypothetical protein
MTVIFGWVCFVLGAICSFGAVAYVGWQPAIGSMMMFFFGAASVIGVSIAAFIFICWCAPGIDDDGRLFDAKNLRDDVPEI